MSEKSKKPILIFRLRKKNTKSREKFLISEKSKKPILIFRLHIHWKCGKNYSATLLSLFQIKQKATSIDSSNQYHMNKKVSKKFLNFRKFQNYNSIF